MIPKSKFAKLALAALVFVQGQSSLAQPSLRGESTYISDQATEWRVRSKIDIFDGNFMIAAFSEDPKVGEGSHDGGAISIKEYDDFYYLQGIGTFLPKAGVSSWTLGAVNCSRLPLNGDADSIVCLRTDDRKIFSSIYSKSRGFISFTGFCFITKDNLCNYVLISSRGIMYNP